MISSYSCRYCEKSGKRACASLLTVITHSAATRRRVYLSSYLPLAKIEVAIVPFLLFSPLCNTSRLPVIVRFLYGALTLFSASRLASRLASPNSRRVRSSSHFFSVILFAAHRDTRLSLVAGTRGTVESEKLCNITHCQRAARSSRESHSMLRDSQVRAIELGSRKIVIAQHTCVVVGWYLLLPLKLPQTK